MARPWRAAACEFEPWHLLRFLPPGKSEAEDGLLSQECGNAGVQCFAKIRDPGLLARRSMEQATAVIEDLRQIAYCFDLHTRVS
jgi:hypothetical protein